MKRDNLIFGIKTVDEPTKARIELYLFGKKTEGYQFSVDEIIAMLQDFQQHDKELKEKWGDDGMDSIKRMISSVVDEMLAKNPPQKP